MSCISALLAVCAISNMSVSQNWPWDSRVVIDYTLTGEQGKTYDLDLQIQDPTGQSVSCWSGAFNDDDLINVAPGAHRLVWDPEKMTGSADSAAIGMKFTLTCKEAETAGKYMVIGLAGPANDTVEYLNDVPAGGWTEEHMTSKMVFRRIRPGYFQMGSPTNEVGHLDKRNSGYKGLDCQGEAQHPVLLTNEYWIAICPATYSQICYIDDRSKYDGAGAPKVTEGSAIDYSWSQSGKRYPIRTLNLIRLVGENNVTSWPTSTDVGADSIIGQMRTRLAGKGAPTGLVLSLPTQAQWEYACRAGTTTAWNNGTDCNPDETTGVDVNLDLLGIYQPLGGTAVLTGNVCQKKPNAWGLYDCHGLVGEVVHGHGAQNNATTAETEPTSGGCTADMYCSIRGGWSQQCYAVHCRSATKIHCNQYSNKGKTAYTSSGSNHSVRFAFIHPRHNGVWE